MSKKTMISRASRHVRPVMDLVDGIILVKMLLRRDCVSVIYAHLDRLGLDHQYIVDHPADPMDLDSEPIGRIIVTNPRNGNSITIHSDCAGLSLEDPYYSDLH